MQSNFRLLFTLSSLCFFFLNPAKSTPTNPQFPCKSPHFNSYRFCNASLSTSTRAQSLLSHLSLPEKISALCNNFSGVPRLGIPPYEWWSESLHGIATNGPGISFDGPIKSATMFPQVLLTSASFNRTLWSQIASSVAVEGRAMYNTGQAGLTFWAPVINVFRDPRWGRGQETPGEDPVVVSIYGAEFVKGFQSGGIWGSCVGERRALEENGSDPELMMSACCKHFNAYDLENWGNFSRYSFDAKVTKQDLEDTYEPPFKSCIQEGKASCLMCSYNSVNGIPACGSKDLLQKVRDDWGFNGYIASDCDAVATIFEYQHYTNSPEDAVALALKAGTDINCGTYMLLHTAAAIEQGKVREEDVNRALLNLFSVLIRLRLFDGNPLEGKFGQFNARDVCTQEHKRLALEAARQGIVLLKNEKNFLPFNKDDFSSVAVIGPLANDSSQLGGTYSGVPCDPTTYIAGIQTYCKNTIHLSGCLDVACASTSGVDEAIAMAREVDRVIMIVGINLSQETEDRDRVSLLLPGKQMELVNKVAAVCKHPLVLVLTGGGPLDISFAKEDSRIASILWVGYPGEAGGKALADILFGEYNPGGKLPVTWYPEAFTKTPMNDMHMRPDPSRGYPGRTHRFYTGKSVYEFGHGLSYSLYQYKLLSAPERINIKAKGLILSKIRPYQTADDQISELDSVDVDELSSSCESLKFNTDISVMNAGERDGSHVVLLFSRPSKTVEIEGAPLKQLVGFSRVNVNAYTSEEVRFVVDPCKHLSFSNKDGKRVLPLGHHTLMANDLEHSIFLFLEG
ncbi:hypothetical protein V2J09_014056 [Rumex salicifolius]